jgi:thioesterase domain-containing protein
MHNRLQELRETLAREIPITQHLGISIESYDDAGLTLKAPLQQNINHKSTAFAGSLNALLTLAGWGLLWLLLKERDIHAQIVIQESMSSYLRPVTCDFSARCHKPDPTHIARLETTLRKKGKARLEVQSEIREADIVAVTFSGRYVIFLEGGEVS